MIPEPLGGAHRDHHQTAARVKSYLVKSLRALEQLPPEQLLEARYRKFRRMGVFVEAGVQAGNGVDNGAAADALAADNGDSPRD